MSNNIKTLESLILDEERPLKTANNVEELAEKIARMIILLSSAKHNPEEELRQEEKLQTQVLKVTQVMIRDVDAFKSRLRDVTLAVGLKKDLLNNTEDLLKNLKIEEVILHNIGHIISAKDEDRYNELHSLIKQLLGMFPREMLDLTSSVNELERA